MNSIDIFLDLSTQVWDLSRPEPSKDELEFYRSYASSANDAILEPMCGTGRFLLPLLAEGFNVEGFDASSHMLKALFEKAKQKNLTVNVWQNSIEDLNISKKYSLIIIPCGSFNLIVDIKKLNDILLKIHDLLTDDGVFVFECLTNHWKAPELNIWSGKVWPRSDGKIILANILTLPDRNDIRQWIYKYELVDGNQIIQTEIENFKARLHHVEALDVMLNNAGFKKTKRLKAYDRDKTAANDDEAVVYECQKS